MQQEEVELVDCPLLRMHAPEGHGDLQAHADRVEHRPVRDGDVHAPARLALELACGRRESDRHERHSRNPPRSQGVGEPSAVEPGGADHLEGGVGAAAHREVRELEQADARVEKGLGKASHVGRRIHPLQSRRIERIGPPPALAGDHGEVEVELQIGCEHRREFADRHAVAERDRMAADERAATLVHQRTGDRDTVDRIWPVEHHEGLFMLGRRLHRLEHGRDIGIEAAADVLNVEHERIDLGEHLRRGSLRLAVEALHGNARLLVLAVRHVGLVKGAAGPVLRPEDRDELHVVGFGKQARRAAPPAVAAGVVGDHRHPLAGERTEAVADEHVDAGENWPIARGLRLGPWLHHGRHRRRRDPGDQRVDQPLAVGMHAV